MRALLASLKSCFLYVFSECLIVAGSDSVTNFRVRLKQTVCGWFGSDRCRFCGVNEVVRMLYL